MLRQRRQRSSPDRWRAGIAAAAVVATATGLVPAAGGATEAVAIAPVPGARVTLVDAATERVPGAGPALDRSAAPHGPEFAQPAAAQATELAQLSESMGRIVDAVLPSVVQVIVTAYAPSSPEEGGLLNRTQSGGSGVIVDADGYIVTNAHVVEGARRVQVQLPSVIDDVGGGRSILKPSGEVLGATIVGVDRETDLALLKIDRTGLAHLELGDSDELQPGMMVLAFGSPFGLENSVSLGVVSARARQLRPEDPMIYIQTDAPINPGNSGGALVDMAGRVVGINTMIFSQSGGNEGIGFAAPSNIVRFVYEQLREHRRVRRGVIGILTQTITPTMARALGLPRDWGVIVSDVLPASPAAAAGLRVGDIILALEGKTMENARQFDVNLYRQEIGGEVELDVMRDDQELRLRAVVVERADDPMRFLSEVSPERNLVPELDVLCVNLDDRTIRLLPPLRVSSGVLVAAVGGSSGPATQFQVGDVIHSLNGVAIRDLQQLKRTLAALPPLSPVVVQVERRGVLLFLTFEVE